MYKSVRKKIATKAYGQIAISESIWLAALEEISVVTSQTPTEIEIQTENPSEEITVKERDSLPQLPA